MSVFPILTAACLLSAGALDPETGRPLNEAVLQSQGNLGTFLWRDAEDQVDGFIDPGLPFSGTPFEVSVRVRALEGESTFTGPVILTVRRVGQQAGESVTIAATGERWKHAFTVEQPGRYQLDVGFRGSRMKMLHTEFDVGRGRFAPLASIALSLTLVAAVLVIGVAIIRTLRKKPAEG